MKKIFSLVLVLVLVLGLNVSVFAAVYYPQFAVYADTALKKANAYKPAGYNYYVIGSKYYEAAGSTTTVMTVVFSQTPVINIGDKIYAIYFYSPTYKDYANFNGFDMDGYLRVNNSTVFNSLAINYFIDDKSTAKFANIPENKIIVTTVKPADITALNTILQQATSIVNDNYTAETWTSLQQSITKAQSVLSAGGYTQIQIDALVVELQSAINNLLEKPPPINIDDLNIVLQDAKAIVNDDYTVETWTDLQNSINDTEIILSSEVYTQIQIDELVVKINKAINNLAKKPLPEPPPPPIVLTRDPSLIGTGEVTPYIDGFTKIFLDNALVVLPSAIGFFTILTGLFIVKKLFKKMNG